MTNNPNDSSDRYLRAAVVISERFGKPLEGTVVAISTWHELSVDEPYFGEVIEQANERFDINSYAADLRLGTLYFDASTRDLVGVSWEESPRPYDHGEFDDAIDQLPENMLSAEDILERDT